MSGELILGISAFYHDSAACLLRDGDIVAAAQEERFTRRKGDETFPRHAVAYCLKAGGASIAQVSYVGFYDKPLLKFERILETYLGIAPRGLVSFLVAGPLWAGRKLYVDHELRRELRYSGEVLYAEHHESHAASAFFPSPFADAAILTIDGVGEWATTSIGIGSGNDVEILKELHWPDSLGLLYSAFTQYLGFKVNSGEYKVMGLAPYGEPKFQELILSELIDLREDGSFRLNQRYFNYLTGLTMTNVAFDDLFGGPSRRPETELTQRDADLAKSIQAVCEEIMLRLGRTAHRHTGSENLCMAGGVALNCVGVGRLLREGPFKQIWVQPAAGDAGGSLGVALLIHHRHKRRPRTDPHGSDSMRGGFLGPEFSPGRIEESLKSHGAVYTRMNDDALIDRAAHSLADQHVVAWFEGRMEFGPRALGARCILADPRDKGMQAKINMKIKRREQFRPFAPSVVREHARDYFDLETDSPYMSVVAPVLEQRRFAPSDQTGLHSVNVPRSDIPAVTHIDYSARLQTVSRNTNPMFYSLIEAFGRLTGCPVVVNTSFNVRGEPIVCTPADAYRCFMTTDIDLLVAGPFVLDKADQPPWGDATERLDVPSVVSATDGRAFGFAIGTAVVCLGALALWREHLRMGGLLAVLGVILAFFGLLTPTLLGYVQRWWLRLAELMSRVTTPIVMAAIYFLMVTPIALARRTIGGNPLVHSRHDDGYWIDKLSRAGRPKEMRHQF